jgi:hypothetical protein
MKDETKTKNYLKRTLLNLANDMDKLSFKKIKIVLQILDPVLEMAIVYENLVNTKKGDNGK